MPRKTAGYNVERQALARSLSKQFPLPVVAKLIGLDLRAATQLLRYEYKTALPSENQVRLAKAVGAIFEASFQAGQRAVAQSLREAADALERGELPALDRDL